MSPVPLLDCSLCLGRRRGLWDYYVKLLHCGPVKLLCLPFLLRRLPLLILLLVTITMIIFFVSWESNMICCGHHQAINTLTSKCDIIKLKLILHLFAYRLTSVFACHWPCECERVSTSILFCHSLSDFFMNPLQHKNTNILFNRFLGNKRYKYGCHQKIIIQLIL